jgi:hypothetical protein
VQRSYKCSATKFAEIVEAFSHFTRRFVCKRQRKHAEMLSTDYAAMSPGDFLPLGDYPVR